MCILRPPNPKHYVSKTISSTFKENLQLLKTLSNIDQIQ